MCENGKEFVDSVDPRVHIELERLNNSTDDINKREVELDEARNGFRQLLCDSIVKVDSLRLTLGICVERAKPYYTARYSANEALKETQTAAKKFEKANSAHSAAREMVYLAEQGLGGRTLDPAWQEMLNHATQRVNEAECERALAEMDHRLAFAKHEAANINVHSLQKDLKRAIAKSSLSIRRSLLKINSLLSQHELLFLPYYELKAYYNQLLDQKKSKILNLEIQISKSKLTYAEALRNLEQISDAIHQTRKKALGYMNKQRSLDSTVSMLDDAQEFIGYKCLPQTIEYISSKRPSNEDEVAGESNPRTSNTLPPSFSSIIPCNMAQSQSSEWTEINLENSSSEEEIQLHPREFFSNAKPKLTKQITMPRLSSPMEFSSVKNHIKLDSNISDWIAGSSKTDIKMLKIKGRRQSLENLLGPTSEKMKDFFSHGMMMLNINALTERRNSEPKLGVTEDKFVKKNPSPLEKNLTYLNVDDDPSDTESLSSVDMLNEDQIDCLMLDKEIESVCGQVLGAPIHEIVSFHKKERPGNYINLKD